MDFLTFAILILVPTKIMKFKSFKERLAKDIYKIKK